MRVDVLLFGPQATLVQADRVAVTVDSQQVTAAALLGALAESAPALAASLETSRLAVNHAYAQANDIITSDDEVALIGMVSGG